jgi:hypothetical protein
MGATLIPSGIFENSVHRPDVDSVYVHFLLRRPRERAMGRQRSEPWGFVGYGREHFAMHICFYPFLLFTFMFTQNEGDYSKGVLYNHCAICP